MKNFVVGVLLLFQPLYLHCQDRLASIMTILGVSEEEMLSEQTLEHFESLEHHPVELNLASFSKLMNSGLFSQFQVASLMDYRAEHGDVLSFEELSAVDGFGKSFAEALKPYVSLYSSLAPGAVQTSGSDGSVTLRSTWKPGDFAAKGKMSYNYGDRLSAFFATNLDTYSCNVAYYGRKHLGKIIIGDFNARFGQGLTVWSGFSMSGMSSPSSFFKRPTGLAPSASYAGGLKGIATDFNWKHFTVSAFVTYPSFTTGVSCSYLFRYGQFSLNGVGRYDDELQLGKLGADTRLCIKGVDIFGEACVDAVGLSMAGIAGVSIPWSKSRYALCGRYYPATFTKELGGAVRSGTYSRDEAGASLSWERGNMVVCADYYYKLSTGREQLKLLATHDITLGGAWSIKPRASIRLRTMNESSRTDLRCDLLWKPVPWSNTLRINWLHCLGNGWLAYYEFGYTGEKLTAYARITGFLIDNWDDRIYSYERDAPGNFNIPAYYGRGGALNLNVAWKPELKRNRLKIYGLAQIKKPGKPGLRFQISYEF